MLTGGNETAGNRRVADGGGNACHRRGLAASGAVPLGSNGGLDVCVRCGYFGRLAHDLEWFAVLAGAEAAPVPRGGDDQLLDELNAPIRVLARRVITTVRDRGRARERKGLPAIREGVDSRPEEA